MSDPKTFDPLAWIVLLVFGGTAAACVAYVIYLFFSVVLFGEGTGCPQNLCLQ